MFGVKGGAAGGGWTQIVPMEDLNLHFTGDMHAIGAANNLLAAMIDAHIHHGNELGIDLNNITWRRAIDMNDRALRNNVVALGGRTNGQPRETGFDITAASEVMALMAVTRDLTDLRERLGKITIGYSREGKAITAEDLGAAGAMTVLLKDALKPNLVQTLEGQPCLMHTGPFANIASGNNSLVADRIGMKLADYIVTESGFGADMGMEKFFDIVCRFGDLTPSAVVLVCTVRAIRHHAGGDDGDLEEGFANVAHHLQTIEKFGLPAVVAVNRRPGDSDEDVEAVRQLALKAGAHGAEINEGFEKGGEGVAKLAEAVVAACDAPSDFKLLYPDDASIEDKIDGGGHGGLRRRRRDLLARRAAEDRAVHEGRPRPLPRLHGQDAAVAERGPQAPRRAEGLRDPRARHPRLHRRRLARPAVRRHHADAGPRRQARRAEHRHRQGRQHRRPVLGPMPFADRPLRDVLSELAARQPVPGGGASAAWACALGAGLVEMAAAYGDLDAIGGEARELRARALELAERDGEGYAPGARGAEDGPVRSRQGAAAGRRAVGGGGRAAADRAGVGPRRGDRGGGRARRHAAPAR